MINLLSPQPATEGAQPASGETPSSQRPRRQPIRRQNGLYGIIFTYYPVPPPPKSLGV